MKTSYHFRITLSIIIGIVLVGLSILIWAQQTGKITIFGETITTPCIQVITPAYNPKPPYQCASFATSCDVPSGWTPIGSCDSFVPPSEPSPNCAQVVTHAYNPNPPYQCKDFATPCDVTSGWIAIPSCDDTYISLTPPSTSTLAPTLTPTQTNSTSTTNASSTTSSASTKTDTSSTTSAAGTQSIAKLVSTGANLWLNILIALLLATGIAYFLVWRKKK